jgi:DNA-binding transcriptional MocR family regulator
MDWSPAIADRTGPFYLRIVEALRADVASGRLHRGQQLPTQRALAKHLGLDLTTVTRAYSEARRSGLTEARVGQGTFVAESASQAPRAEQQRTEVDLSMNIPPQPLEADIEGRIMRGLAAIQRDTGFFGLLNYRQPGGSAEERAIASTWLSRRVDSATPETVLISSGTQTALLAFLLANTSPGDVVLAEASTFPGFKAAAAFTRVKIVGVPLDEFGIIPDALDEACSRHRPKAVYLIPTIHNPTTATMPLKRREAVARIIEAHGVALFEDDAYGLLAPDVPPLASLIPRQTHYALSLSKCLAPGLRVSLLAAPDPIAAARFAGALRACVQMPASLMVALVMRWLQDGSADSIIAAIRSEAAARQRIASQILANVPFAADPRGHHIWMPLPSQWSRIAFLSHIQRQGLAGVTGDVFSIDEAPHAIRVSLGAARSRAELAGALHVLASAFGTAASTAHIV